MHQDRGTHSDRSEMIELRQTTLMTGQTSHILTLQLLLRHSKVTTTRICMHMTIQRLKDLDEKQIGAKELESLLREPRQIPFTN